MHCSQKPLDHLVAKARKHFEARAAPTDAFAAAFEQMQVTIVNGLGREMPFRHMSSKELKENPVLVACTLLNPARRLFNWTREGGDGPAPISADVMDKARKWIVSKAFACAKGLRLSANS